MAMKIEHISKVVEAEANYLSATGKDEAATALRSLLLRENEDTLVRFANILIGVRA